MRVGSGVGCRGVGRGGVGVCGAREQRAVAQQRQASAVALSSGRAADSTPLVHCAHRTPIVERATTAIVAASTMAAMRRRPVPNMTRR